MRAADHERGFTLIELVVVISVLTIVAVMAFPALQQFIMRRHLEGFNWQASSLMMLARQEAVKRGHPVVVAPDFDGRRIAAYLDVNRNFDFDGPDREFANIALPRGNGPAQLYFWGPPGTPYESPIGGFDDSWGLAVFQTDGTVMDEGSYRVGDLNGNFFEVRVGPTATGTATVMKYNQTPPSGDARYVPQGRTESGPLWVWYDLDFDWGFGDVSFSGARPDLGPNAIIDWSHIPD